MTDEEKQALLQKLQDNQNPYSDLMNGTFRDTGRVASSPGEYLDSVIGAPARTAIEQGQKGNFNWDGLKKVMGSIGSDPKNAPTGVDLASNMGIQNPYLGAAVATGLDVGAQVPIGEIASAGKALPGITGAIEDVSKLSKEGNFSSLKKMVGVEDKVPYKVSSRDGEINLKSPVGKASGMFLDPDSLDERLGMSSEEHGLDYQNPYYLEGLEVDPKAQGQGYGSKILNKITDKAQKQGADGIVLNASPMGAYNEMRDQSKLPDLVKFYEKNGFTPIKDEGGNVLMHKPLSSTSSAQALIDSIKTPEEAAALSPEARQQYLNALDEIHGPQSQRAKDMGFGNKTWYHGTSAPIEQFQNEAKGASTRAASAKQGFFFAQDPSTASDYANLAADKGVNRDQLTWRSAAQNVENLTQDMRKKYNLGRDAYVGQNYENAIDNRSPEDLQHLGLSPEDANHLIAKHNEATELYDKYQDSLPDDKISDLQHDTNKLLLQKATRGPNEFMEQDYGNQIARAQANLEKFPEDADFLNKKIDALYEKYQKAKNGIGSPEEIQQLAQQIQNNRNLTDDLSKSRGQNVVPVRLKGNPLVKDYKGQGYRDESYSDLMQAAQEQGKDSVLFKNTFDPGDSSNRVKQNIASVFNPNQIRSTNAAFDPRFKDSANLLAGQLGPSNLNGTNLIAPSANALSPDLQKIAQIESSGGQNKNHETTKVGLNAGDTAGGSTGMMPIMAQEILKKNPELAKKYPELTTTNHDDITSAINNNPAMESELANAHWDRLNKVFSGDTARMAYAWRNGITAAKKASDVQVQEHPYVQKFLNGPPARFSRLKGILGN